MDTTEEKERNIVRDVAIRVAELASGCSEARRADKGEVDGTKFTNHNC